MITTQNEFIPVKAFTHIAGSSLGTWSNRDTACQMVTILNQVSQYDCAKLWEDIATESDDGAYLIDVQDDVADLLNEYMPMVEFCTVCLEDGEWSVIPSIELADDECENFSDYQDDYKGDFILVTNDHGNVTCMQWNDIEREYITIWDMV